MDAFGIYIHWPYCAAKCPYCDFNSHVRRAVSEERYRAASLRELEFYADFAPGRRVSSVFFGGGTPSLMSPATADSLLAAIASHWDIAPDAEITLEANPSSVEAGRFADFRAAGINRVSLGIQSLRDAELRFLGRLHNVAEAREALDRRHGLPAGGPPGNTEIAPAAGAGEGAGAVRGGRPGGVHVDDPAAAAGVLRAA